MKTSPFFKSDAELLQPEEAAKILGVSAGTLGVWRCTKRYPLPYVKLGSRAIRYRLADVMNFIEAGRVER